MICGVRVGMVAGLVLALTSTACRGTLSATIVHDQDGAAFDATSVDAASVDAANRDAASADARDPPITDASNDASHAVDAGPPRVYPPGPPGCGLSAAAFCDTFDDAVPVSEADARHGRVGELDPRRWSGARMQPGLNFGAAATPVRPATLPACRRDLPRQVLPGQDAVVCDGDEQIQSRHLLMAAAEQSYGQLSLRVRQPFDFHDRTGTVVFDVEGEITGFLQGWVSLAITEDPSPAPSFGILQNFENGPIPRVGVEVHLFQICGAEDRVGVAQVNVFRDYAETFYLDNENGRSATCVSTARGALNHFEVRISRTHLEVWGTDHASDGVHFADPRLLFSLDDLDLPFDRGYVHISTHNHSSLKYSDNTVDAWTARWDNVGFDGPVINDRREYSIPDAMDAVHIDNVDCMNIGYQLGDVSEGPAQTFTFHDVDTRSFVSARLALNAHFNMGNGTPYESYVLRYRVNDGPWRDHRFDAHQLRLLNGPDVFNEAGDNTRGDGTGIAGGMSLVLPVDNAALIAGDNTLQFVTSGVPYSYRPYVANIDLVLID